MTLEGIAETYGMHDYYDMVSGNTYRLSEATDAPCEGVELAPDELRVPVWAGPDFVGYAKMKKPKK